MKNIITLQTSCNCFGDTIISFCKEEYAVFQYNCFHARELLDKLKSIKNTIYLIAEGEYYITFKPAIKYLEDMIQLDADAKSVYDVYCDTRGAEVASHYGY